MERTPMDTVLIYQTMPSSMSIKIQNPCCFKIEIQRSVSKNPELGFHFKDAHLHLEFALHNNHFIIYFPINIQQ
jgi:hypothetical protein